MNRGKHPMTQANQKKMKKEVHKAQKAYLIKPVPVKPVKESSSTA